jgi:SAM-dependent methyltransferase
VTSVTVSERASVMESAKGKARVHSAARLVSALEGYTLWAESYDDDPNPLLALEERAVEPLLPDLKGKNLLDVGCGTGRWLRRLVPRGIRLAIGLDSCAGMAVRAAAGLPLRSHLVLADCCLLPLPPRIADLIVCSFVAAHVTDLGALAHELSRLARPGADLFLTDLHPEARTRGWRSTFRHWSGPVEVRGFVHTRQDTEGSFESEGFGPSQSLDLHLGEPERPFFVRAGKAALFEVACLEPAVALYHFVRR